MNNVPNKTKVVITGSGGMLGQAMAQVFAQAGFVVHTFDRQQLDIADHEQVQQIRLLQPEVIVNCAAYTQVDLAETDREQCWRGNVVGVQELVGVTKVVGATLVHFSTGYVFSGTLASYTETAVPDPVNYYGETKVEGERIIQDKLTKYYIVRTSWLFDLGGNNFIETMLRLAAVGDPIRVVNDQIGSPTNTSDLAAAIPALLEHEYGLYHITNRGSCSWYDLAKFVFEHEGCETELCACSTAEFPQAAVRPAHSTLENNKLTPLRSWEAAVTDYLRNRSEV